MSTSSENTTPSSPEDLVATIDVANWDAMVYSVSNDDRDALANWIDSDLSAMEDRLSQFASKRSREFGAR